MFKNIYTEHLSDLYRLAFAGCLGKSVEDTSIFVRCKLMRTSAVLTWNKIVKYYHIFDFCVFPEKLLLQKVCHKKSEIKIIKPCQTFKTEIFVKILNGFHLLTVFAKRTILNIQRGSE